MPATATAESETLKSEDLIVWIKDRPNHVQPIRHTHLRCKHASKYGYTFKGPDGNGNTVDMSVNRFGRIKPTILEITDPPCPIEELLEIAAPVGIFESVKHLRIYNAGLKSAQLVRLLELCSSLESIEYHDFAHFDVIDRVREILVQERKIRCYDVVFPLNTNDLEESLCKMENLETVRFSAPPGIDMTTVLALQKPMVAVKTLILAEMCFDTPFDDRAVKAIDRIFPNLQHLFMDWNMRSEEIEFTKNDEKFIDALIKFHNRRNLAFTVINIYSPVPSMKEAAKNLHEYVLQFFRQDKVKLKGYGSTGLMSAPANFCYIAIGEQTAKLARLEEVLANYSSTPDLRHFAYAIDNDPWHAPDLTLEFGGLCREAIAEAIKDPPQVIMVPDMNTDRQYDD